MKFLLFEGMMAVGLGHLAPLRQLLMGLISVAKGALHLLRAWHFVAWGYKAMTVVVLDMVIGVSDWDVMLFLSRDVMTVLRNQIGADIVKIIHLFALVTL